MKRFIAIFGSVVIAFGLVAAIGILFSQSAYAADAPAVGATAYKISVKQSGIYQVTYAALQAAGVPVANIDPATVQLHNQGSQVPIDVVGDGDALFEAGEYILFYGQKLETKYTNLNVYWLKWGGSLGLRMATVDGTPNGGTTPAYFQTTQHAEVNTTYQSFHPSGAQNDHWYWDGLFSGGAVVSKLFPVTLNNVAKPGIDIHVRGLLKGQYQYPTHHTRIYLNNNLIDDSTWYGKSDFAFDKLVPDSFLVEGANQIKVELAMGGGITSDLIFINWFEIDYNDTYTAENDLLYFEGDSSGTWLYDLANFTTTAVDIFDITNPGAPERIISASSNAPESPSAFSLQFSHVITQEHKYLALTASRYLSPQSILPDVSSDLMNSANSANYLVITHGNFYTDILPLATYRASKGFLPMVVKVEDIYDEFNAGVVDAEAIRSFLQHVYDYWTPAGPVYVVLVGDGNYDPNNYMASNEPSYIPPYLLDIDPWLGETAADNRYVTVFGNDYIADMYLGRLPVKSAAETAAVVNKLIGYETSVPVGGWNDHILFVTDNPDTAGDFYALSDRIADNFVPASYIEQKIYYTTTQTVAATRTAVINAINSGQLIVSYVGHGDPAGWALEDLYDRTVSLPFLTNGQKLPFFVPMTCLEGYYITPPFSNKDRSSLAEHQVRAIGYGAIASWSPTGFGVATDHDKMQEGLFTAIFQDNKTRLGPAINQGQTTLVAQTLNPYHYLLDTYVLLGDPATKLSLPTPTSTTASGFQAESLPGADVRLSWSTAYEVNLSGFNLYRSTAGLNSLIKINSVLIPSQGQWQPEGADYEWIDAAAQPGTSYQYWLETVDLDGTTSRYGPVNMTAWLRVMLPVIVR